MQEAETRGGARPRGGAAQVRRRRSAEAAKAAEEAAKAAEARGPYTPLFSRAAVMRPRVQSWWALAVALSPAAGAAPAVGFFKPDNVRRGVYFYNTHGTCLGLHVYNHDSMEVRRACLAREQGGEAAVFALPPMAPPPPPSVVLQGEAYFRKHQHCDGLDSGDPNLPIVVVERERRACSSREGEGEWRETRGHTETDRSISLSLSLSLTPPPTHPSLLPRLPTFV